MEFRTNKCHVSLLIESHPWDVQFEIGEEVVAEDTKFSVGVSLTTGLACVFSSR